MHKESSGKVARKDIDQLIMALCDAYRHLKGHSIFYKKRGEASRVILIEGKEFIITVLKALEISRSKKHIDNLLVAEIHAAIDARPAPFWFTNGEAG